MNELMDWTECEKIFVRQVSPDANKIKAIVKASEKREIFIAKIPEDSESISFIVENQYEIIKELLVALLLTKGVRSKNHQCLISYFYKNYPQYESYAHLIAELCYLRNRLEYYGELIDKSFYEKNKEKIKRTITILKQMT